MQRGSIIKLIGFYHVEAIEMNAKAKITKCEKSREYFQLCKAMAIHRKLKLNIRLLSGCTCGSNHSREIKELSDQVEALEEFLLQDIKPPQV